MNVSQPDATGTSGGQSLCLLFTTPPGGEGPRLADPASHSHCLSSAAMSGLPLASVNLLDEGPV